MTRGNKVAVLLAEYIASTSDEANAHSFIFFIRNVQYMSKIYGQDKKNPLHGITEFLTTEVSCLPLKHLLLATIGYQYRLMISLIPRDIFSL